MIPVLPPSVSVYVCVCMYVFRRIASAGKRHRTVNGFGKVCTGITACALLVPSGGHHRSDVLRYGVCTPQCRALVGLDWNGSAMFG